MRSDAVAVPKADTETRILVFGDSVINGGNTIDQSELATTIVANEQHGAGHDAYVGNVSAISWGPGNWLAYAREFGFIDADIVVLVLSGHDRHDNPTFAPLSPSTHPTKAPPSALLEALARYRAASVSSARVEGQVTYEDLAQEADADTRQGLEDLERFLSLAMASSQHVRVFYHPDRSEFDAGNVGEDFDVIRKTVESGGQTLVSLLPHYRILSGDSDALYADVIHPTGLGQRGIANAIIKSIATLE